MFAYDEGAGVRQRACGVAVGNLHETLILPSQLYILSLIGDNHTLFSSCKQDENSVWLSWIKEDLPWIETP